jgi:hypothetical protein
MPDSYPPPEEESHSPAVQYAAYPRPGMFPAYGNPEKLKALSDGYHGLTLVFLMNVALMIAVQVVAVALLETGVLIGLFGFAFLLIGVSTYPFNKKIAFGKGWTDRAAIMASVLMALNSALFCGIIGFFVMQMIAAAEIKAYGVRSGILGFKRRDVMARVQELRAQQPAAQPF